LAFLITHSLLSAWSFLLKENPYETAESTANPMEDFMRVLRREPTDTTEAMQNGIDFENDVTAIVQGRSANNEKWQDAAAKVAQIIQGGRLQHVAKETVTVGGTPYLLYGRLDALKGGTIYDIKFSRSYDRGKFFTSTQHPAYLELVPEANDFVYLVSNGTDVWTEHYTREETRSILPTIQSFADWLDGQGLTPVYRQYWLAK